MYLSSIAPTSSENNGLNSDINPELRINCGIRSSGSQLWYNMLLYDNKNNNNLFPTDYDGDNPKNFMMKITDKGQESPKLGINFERTEQPQSTKDVNGSLGLNVYVYSGSQSQHTIQNDVVIHVIDPPVGGVSINLSNSYNVNGRILTFKRKANVRTESTYQIFLKIVDSNTELQLGNDDPIDSITIFLIIVVAPEEKGSKY